MLRSQTQYESQIKTLKVDVSEMKRTKVRIDLLYNDACAFANQFSDVHLRFAGKTDK